MNSGFPSTFSKNVRQIKEIIEFRFYEAKIKGWESNPGHLWLEPPVLCHLAMTAGHPPTLKWKKEKVTVTGL